MTIISKVYAYGKSTVDDKWNYTNKRNTNRLYYIHGGKGSYVLGTTKYEFIPGKLYFLPYTTEIYPKGSHDNPILHTFADFELIPPAISNYPAIFSPKTDEMTFAAFNVFLEGAKIHDGSTDELFLASIEYLVRRASAICDFTFLQDEIIISALEYMIENMSENIRIDSIAKRYFMTADTFIRRFSKAICTTPYAWLKNTRLKTANALLNNGKNLSETAIAVGYSDASSLLHALRENK